tara:strand:+ start:359219 stop:359722 length:504 start_codon:yes stop_codon:yes gene_type:complete
MLTKHYLVVFKHVFLMTVMGVLLAACDQNAEDSKVTEVEVVAPTLSDKNIQSFTLKMAEDYNANLDSLMVGFHQAKKEDDAYKFVNFRNQQWTPNYIKQKDYYQTVLARNAAYLSNSPSRPLFDKFESLIYIGINLKNALLDDDNVKLQAQFAEIKKDKAIVNRLIK